MRVDQIRPGDIIIRYSELNTLTRCALQHRVVYAAGLQPPTISETLVRGLVVHSLLAGWYKSFRDDDERGVPRDPAKAYQWAYVELDAAQQQEGWPISPELRELCDWMFDGYRRVYGTDDRWSKISVVDETRLFELVTYQDHRIILQCTADLVAFDERTGRWLIIDHKTAKGRDVSKTAFAKENHLDPQRGLYFAAFKLKDRFDGAPKLPVWSAYHNSIRADRLKREMTDQERFARHPEFFSDIELESIWEEAQAVGIDALRIRFGLDGGGVRWSSPSPDSCRMCSLKEPHMLARATGRDLVEVAQEFGYVLPPPPDLQEAEPLARFIRPAENTAPLVSAEDWEF